MKKAARYFYGQPFSSPKILGTGSENTDIITASPTAKQKLYNV